MFSAEFFGENILKNHNIGPRLGECFFRVFLLLVKCKKPNVCNRQSNLES
jgi:hypothetical protein